MKTLHGMVLRSFLPMFLVSLLFFVLILQLVDVFAYIWRYISLEVPFLEVARSQLYYLPKCISYSVSPSLLFAVSFTLGTFYSNNELIAVFGSGVPLFRLVLPLLFLGAALSAGGFYFEENVVIDTFRIKNTMSQDLLKQRKSMSNTNVTVISNDRRLIYSADYYNDTAGTLRGLVVVERGSDGSIRERIDAEQAVWRQDAWELLDVRRFYWDEEGESLLEENVARYSRPDMNEPPEIFRKTVRSVDEMTLAEAAVWIEGLRRAGYPFREPLTEYYRRYSFSLTPLIVAFISCAIGGRFKKNILLMSLLASLVVSVLYYVTQMMSVLMAKLGVFSPLAGAWMPFIAFALVSVWLFRVART